MDITDLQMNAEQTIDVMSDRVAVITVGGMLDNLGCVLSCNMEAGQLFGYTPIEIVKENVSILLPQPFAQVHDMLMRVRRGRHLMDAKHMMSLLWFSDEGTCSFRRSS